VALRLEAKSRKLTALPAENARERKHESYGYCR
jgi:hypothetical protein